MMMSQLIHGVGIAIFGIALYLDLWVIQIPDSLTELKAFPGRFKFLTIWNIVLQLVYHSLGLLNDLVGSNERTKRRQSKLQEIRDGYFTSWAFPIGMFVSLSFWGLYVLDRKLVYPELMDEFYPKWLNHFVHTGPITLLMLEILTVPRVLPKRSIGVIGILAFSWTYLLWIIWVFAISGVWVYPVLQIMNNLQRTLFLSAVSATILGLYFLGEFIHKLRWGRNEEPAVVSKSITKGSSKIKSSRKDK